jgi:hypothetical protein
MAETNSLVEEILDLVEAAKSGKKWIQKAIKHPGALHRELGVPADKDIPAAKLKKAAKAGGKEGKRARFAMTLKKLRRKKS